MNGFDDPENKIFTYSNLTNQI